LVEFNIHPKTQALYQELKKEGAVEMENGCLEVNNALSMVLRAQQLTSGFTQLEDDLGNKHIELLDEERCKALADLLVDFPGNEPVVVFAKFRQDIKNIRRVCSDLGRKVSEISGRCDEYDDWYEGKTSVLIVQIESGAEGLDFTKARYAIYYSLTHKLWLYTQSRKRLHRPGQKHPVTYYILLGKLRKGKSVDEGMLNSLNQNEDFIQKVLREKSI
jgi:SNF2 family DNA or RNA helicase